MKTKHTEGEWKAKKIKYVTEGGNYYINNEIGNSFITVWGITEESKANAKLIVEAGNVANETGYTPRQLAEQKADLLEALKELVDCDYTSVSCTMIKVKKAIKKATS